jgi:hypothetical protein
MFRILANTFNVTLRRDKWDAPDHWKQRRLMSDHEAFEEEILRRRTQLGQVGRL